MSQSEYIEARRTAGMKRGYWEVFDGKVLRFEP